MAASSSDLELPGGVEDLANYRLSPLLIVMAKWSGAFRYALLFMDIPLLVGFTRIGPHFAHWKEFLLAVGYMLAVSSGGDKPGCRHVHVVPARPSGGPGRDARLGGGWPRGSLAPWFALANPAPGGAFGDALALSSPILVLEALVRLLMNRPSTWATWVDLWIVVYVVDCHHPCARSESQLRE